MQNIKVVVKEDNLYSVEVFRMWIKLSVSREISSKACVFLCIVYMPNIFLLQETLCVISQNMFNLRKRKVSEQFSRKLPKRISTEADGSFLIWQGRDVDHENCLLCRLEIKHLTKMINWISSIIKARFNFCAESLQRQGTHFSFRSWTHEGIRSLMLSFLVKASI